MQTPPCMVMIPMHSTIRHAAFLRKHDFYFIYAHHVGIVRTSFVLLELHSCLFMILGVLLLHA